MTIRRRLARSNLMMILIPVAIAAILLLLDLMLPGVDGFTICRRVREEKKLPIVMVSARTGDADKIRGLGFGADDYVEKPFSPSVLVARVKVHLAQVERLQPPRREEKVVTAGALTAKLDARQIFKNGVEIPLKNREYELLLFLMRYPGQVFSREDLYELIWGLESMATTSPWPYTSAASATRSRTTRRSRSFCRPCGAWATA